MKAWQSRCGYGKSQTCGRPPSPAMHVKLSSLDLNRSNSAGGVFKRGAGPGAVGSDSTPSAPSSPSKCAEILCLSLRAAWICKHYTGFTATTKKERSTLLGVMLRESLCTQKQPQGITKTDDHEHRNNSVETYLFTHFTVSSCITYIQVCTVCHGKCVLRLGKQLCCKIATDRQEGCQRRKCAFRVNCNTIPHQVGVGTPSGSVPWCLGLAQAYWL